MYRKNVLILSTTLLIASIVLGACAPATPEATVAPVEPTEPPPGPTEVAPEPTAEPTPDVREFLTLAHSSQFGGSEELDPASPTRFSTVSYILFDRMVDLDVGGKPKGRLLESWEVDETGQRWTFHVRQGVRFHDGKPLTVHDIVYSIQHVLDPEIDLPAAAVFELVDLEGLETPDDYTLVVPLDRPHSDFALLMTDYRMRVIPEGSKDDPNSPDYLEKTGNATGPFILETLDISGTTVLVANDDYWAGPPGLAGINVVNIADADARVQAFLAGQVDVLWEMPHEQAELFEGNPDYQLVTRPSGGWQNFAMRTTVPPFDDVRVRQALRLVVDREEMLAIAAQGNGVIACDTPVHHADQYYLEQDCPQDIERAKELLAEAGYEDGLTVELHVSEQDPYMIPMAVVYKEQAAEAGINVEIIQRSADGYWNEVWLIEPFCASHWGERHADQVLNEVFRCGASWNEIDWCNEDFDALLDAARSETDFETRRSLYHQAQELLVNEGGEIIPFFTNVIRVYDSRLRGLPKRADDIYDYQDFYFEPEE